MHNNILHVKTSKSLLKKISTAPHIPDTKYSHATQLTPPNNRNLKSSHMSFAPQL